MCQAEEGGSIFGRVQYVQRHRDMKECDFLECGGHWLSMEETKLKGNGRR